MLFNSLEFAIFLPIVFGIYWMLNRHLGIQNFFLVAASFFFYGWWDWRFLILLVLSASIDYIVALQLNKQRFADYRRILVGISVVANIGILCYFKYYNFFVDSFVQSFSFFGYHMSADRLNIVLPVGISFYTFQALSYTFDVYYNRLEPSRSLIKYFAFISFFPQLVAGPIERATNLLPQFSTPRAFVYDEAVTGVRLILWGLFKKMVIADNCALVVNSVFESPSDYSALLLVTGVVFFAFQIYGDFSGYSDIAVGTAKLFGFSLMTNFSYPYFSRDIAEFWRRWHISLSTWFKDYLYFPLGGSRKGKAIAIRNTVIIFLISGLWHGANWTFVIWGAIHALLFIPSIVLGRNKKSVHSAMPLIPDVKTVFSIVLTFSLVCFSWIFFRAIDIGSAINYIQHIFTNPIFSGKTLSINPAIMVFIFLLCSVEWFMKNDGINIIKKTPAVIRYSVYYFLVVCILKYGFSQEGANFIYFQF